jgi:hypothetical protein
MRFDKHKQTLQYALGLETESFKQALTSAYNTALETHKFSLLSELEDQKARRQMELKTHEFTLWDELESTKADHGFNLKKFEDELAKAKEVREEQRQFQAALFSAGLDLDSKTRISISERRLEPYKALWGIMADLSPQSTEELQCAQLKEKFRNWYYEGGNGLFLTWQAANAYLLATTALNQAVPDHLVRKAFSDLRTQMKVDMAVYTSDEAISQVGRLDSK